MSKWKVPVQSLTDHIKTAIDVDPWAKEMAEDLLKKHKPITIKRELEDVFGLYGGKCPMCGNWIQDKQRYCGFCGQEVEFK